MSKNLNRRIERIETTIKPKYDTFETKLEKLRRGESANNSPDFDKRMDELRKMSIARRQKNDSKIGGETNI